MKERVRRVEKGVEERRREESREEENCEMRELCSTQREKEDKEGGCLV